MMFQRPLRALACSVAAFTLVVAGAGAAGALDIDQLGLPVTPPSLPIDLGLTPATTGAPTAPAPPPAGAPAVDGSLEPTDPCAQVTEPASEHGAPIAATCPITAANDGGVDMPMCVDVAKVATCAKSEAVTTTTTFSSAGGSGPGSGGWGSTATGAPGTPALPANTGSTVTGTEVSSTDVRGTGGTLPLTGSAIVWLLTIGAALAATGGALARVARRRFS
jgi:LPXTG-motif cell wall-anchored protein